MIFVTYRTETEVAKRANITPMYEVVRLKTFPPAEKRKTITPPRNKYGKAASNRV
jgi:hypothetical protein